MDQNHGSPAGVCCVRRYADASAALLKNLSNDIRQCFRHAENCEREAKLESDPVARQEGLNAAARWIAFARNYEFAERIAGLT